MSGEIMQRPPPTTSRFPRQGPAPSSAAGCAGSRSRGRCRCAARRPARSPGSRRSVVQDDDLVALRQQLGGHVRADKARAAGDQNHTRHNCLFLDYRFKVAGEKLQVSLQRVGKSHAYPVSSWDGTCSVLRRSPSTGSGGVSGCPFRRGWRCRIEAGARASFRTRASILAGLQPRIARHACLMQQPRQKADADITHAMSSAPGAYACWLVIPPPDPGLHGEYEAQHGNAAPANDPAAG